MVSKERLGLHTSQCKFPPVVGYEDTYTHTHIGIYAYNDIWYTNFVFLIFINRNVGVVCYRRVLPIGHSDFGPRYILRIKVSVV